MGKEVTIEAGDLRQRISIYSPPTGVDESGQPLDSLPSMDGWTLDKTRWAKIEPNTGSPYIQSDQIRNLTSHRITMRYNPTLTPRQRIIYGTRIFNVVGLISSEERKVDTIAAAQEVI